jgi:hypothetical protein
MKMDVEDRLPGTCAVVLHQPESGLGKTLLRGDLASLPEDVTDIPIVLIRHIQTIDKMPLWHQQEVQRCLGGYILDNQDPVVLKDLLRRYLASDDLAENTALHSGLLTVIFWNMQQNQKFSVTVSPCYGRLA